MHQVPATSPAGPQRLGRHRRRLPRLTEALRRAGSDRTARRSRRAVLLLAMIWMIGVFDLLFTHFARELGEFQELNPLARPVLGSSVGLAAFKLIPLVAASAILFVLRRRVLAEFACWLVCLVYTGLSFMWLWYFSRLC